MTLNKGSASVSELKQEVSLSTHNAEDEIQVDPKRSQLQEDAPEDKENLVNLRKCICHCAKQVFVYFCIIPHKSGIHLNGEGVIFER